MIHRQISTATTTVINMINLQLNIAHN